MNNYGISFHPNIKGCFKCIIALNVKELSIARNKNKFRNLHNILLYANKSCDEMLHCKISKSVLICIVINHITHFNAKHISWRTIVACKY